MHLLKNSSLLSLVFKEQNIQMKVLKFYRIRKIKLYVKSLHVSLLTNAKWHVVEVFHSHRF